MKAKEENDKEMITKEIKVFDGKEYILLNGDFYINGGVEPNMEKKISISVTSVTQGKQKSQIKNLEEVGIPFHKDANKKIIIDCNLIINGSLTIYTIPLADNSVTSD